MVLTEMCRQLVILKTYELSQGDVIDFTSPEPMYWNKRTPKNKVQKIVCPTHKRIIPFSIVVKSGIIKSSWIIKMPQLNSLEWESHLVQMNTQSSFQQAEIHTWLTPTPPKIKKHSPLLQIIENTK